MIRTRLSLRSPWACFVLHMQLWKYIFLTKESEALHVFSLPEHLTLPRLHAQPGSREGRRSSGCSPNHPPRAAPLTSTLVHSVIMKPRANQFGLLQVHRPARPVVIWSQRLVPVGRRFMRLAGRSCSSVAVHSAARLAVFSRSHHGHLRLQTCHAAALDQPAFSSGISRSGHQRHAEEPVLPSTLWSNMALNLVRFALWTLRDRAAQRRLALR